MLKLSKQILSIQKLFSKSYSISSQILNQSKSFMTSNYKNASFSLQSKYAFSTQGQKGKIDQNFKTESLKFYNNFVEDIIELQKSQDWAVVVPNIQVPLIVDFYADWCQPCKILTPMLIQRVKQAKGQVKLIKINIDKCGDLANSAQIKAVPTVFLVYGNQFIDKFEGVPAKEGLDKFFSTIQQIKEVQNIESIFQKLFNEGRQLRSENKFEEAQKKLLEITDQKDFLDYSAMRDLILCQMYLVQKKMAKFKDYVIKCGKYEQHFETAPPQAKALYYQLKDKLNEFEAAKTQDSGISSLKTEVAAHPQDLSLKFELAEQYKKQQLIEQALQTAIQIVKSNKDWQNKKANKFILDLFAQLGNTSPTTQKYRKLFQRALH